MVSTVDKIATFYKCDICGNSDFRNEIEAKECEAECKRHRIVNITRLKSREFFRVFKAFVF